MYHINNMMNIPVKIKTKRTSLRETQAQFGSRFGVSAMAVSYWEKGLREAPYAVIEFTQNVKLCPKCKGKGVL